MYRNLITLLEELDKYIEVIYNYESVFLNSFAGDTAIDLIAVSFSSESLKIEYSVYDGPIISNSIKIEDFINWLLKLDIS